MNQNISLKTYLCMLAPFIGQLVAYITHETHKTVNCMYVLPLLSLVGFIAAVKSLGQFNYPL